ncbi:MarR family transcriptional regulator [Citromicrobium bathyomarinum]
MLHTESRAAGSNTDLSYALAGDAPADGPAYAPRDGGGLPVAISLFADRPHVREAMRADAQLAGFRVAQAEGLIALDDGKTRALGDLVAVDASGADAATLAMLARLDARIARSGGQLIVATTIGALEPVMVAMGESDPVLLVEPGRGERLVAFGEALARLAGARVRDLSAEDRVAVMRLVERVSLLAEKLDGLMASDDVPRDGSAAFAFGTGQEATGNLHEHRQRGREADALSPVPGLPDPRRIRALIRKRQARTRFFEAELFADPAWDILLDLTAARAEGRRVSVTSLCIASGVPPTTALRWIAQMTREGLLRREEDLVDRRRAFIALSDSAVEAMARYFDATGACDCAGI